MNARSALFDLYGDHLRTRGGAAPVAALVQLLAALDIAGPAVRTAVSRMVRQGWLAPVRLEQGAGYRLTPRAEQRLGDAAARIYRRGIAPWDHTWHLVVFAAITDRARRARTRQQMAYLGYAQLRDNVWVSPRASAEVPGLLRENKVSAQTFRAQHDGTDAALAATAWDLEALGAEYHEWLTEARRLTDQARTHRSDADAFAVRSTLVHEWRKFLFRDPGLPAELLPPRWPGTEAAEFFDTEAERLLPAADRYVDQCLHLKGEP